MENKGLNFVQFFPIVLMVIGFSIWLIDSDSKGECKHAELAIGLGLTGIIGRFIFKH